MEKGGDKRRFSVTLKIAHPQIVKIQNSPIFCFLFNVSGLKLTTVAILGGEKSPRSLGSRVLVQTGRRSNGIVWYEPIVHTKTVVNG